MAKINANEINRTLNKYRAESDTARAKRLEDTDYCCHTNNPNAKRKERQTVMLMARLNKIKAEARREANIRRGLIELQA
jgi:hypothetical protein